MIPVILYSDVDDVIEHANDTICGLGSSVWSGDIDRAETVASQLEVGTSWGNTHFASIGPSRRYLGARWSGVAIELRGGPWAWNRSPAHACAT